MSEVTDSKYNKFRERVKVAVGRSRNTRDDVESVTLDSKKKGQSRRVMDDSVGNVDDGLSKRENAGRRVRLRTESEGSRRGRVSYEGVVERGERGEHSRVGVGKYGKMQCRSGSDADSVSYRKEKLKRREYSDRRSVESKSKDRRIRGGKVRDEAVNYGDGDLKPEIYDRRRKRIYSDRGTDGETTRRKDFSRAGENKFKDDTFEDRRTRRGGSCDSGQSGWKKSPEGRRKSNEDDPIDAIVEDRQFRRRGSCDSEQSIMEKSSTERRKSESVDEKGGMNLRSSQKDIKKVKYVERDDSAYIPLMKPANRRSDSTKQLDQSCKKFTAESPQQSAKDRTQFKKSMAEDSAITEIRPKKKKRVIRIDPHDFSNKRLDDDTAKIDDTKEKKEFSDSSKIAEMSMNAQFRAIQPSPSVLSFVEENLLGRRREIEFRNAGYNIELPVPLDNIPSSQSSERARIDEAVFRNKLEFFAAAKISSSFPPADLAEIAFAGRSNVVKSSLLNALTRQWGVARTSDKPGHTRTINFFKLGPKISLVDLPGYGFAYAKEEAKEAWEELVKEYVSTRVGLKRVCLLIETKWGMKQRDYELIDLMETSKTKFQVILTKTDLSFPIDVARRAMQIEESLIAKKSAVQPVMMVSSRTGAGIRSFRSVLAKVARFVKL